MLLRVDNKNKILIDWGFIKKFFGEISLIFFQSFAMPQIRYNLQPYLVDRVIRLSNLIFHEKNLRHCIELFRDNGYPLDLMFREFNLRIKKLFNEKLIKGNTNDKVKNEDNIYNSKKFFVIPYISNISEIAASLVDKSEFTVGYRYLNNLRKFIKGHKNRTKFNNVVYKICCKNCDASYVESRELKTKIKEHVSNIRLDPRHSVISEHIIKNNRNFDWDNIAILDWEANYNKRLISEMIQIKEQKNSKKTPKCSMILIFVCWMSLLTINFYSNPHCSDLASIINLILYSLWLSKFTLNH